MAQGLVAMAFCVGWEKILKSFFFFKEGVRRAAVELLRFKLSFPLQP